MLTNKFFAVAVVLIARICQARIVIETSSPDESTSSVVDDLVNIVTSCYGDQRNAVGLVGNLPDTLITTLSIQHLIPVVLIEAKMNLQKVPTVEFAFDQFRYKLRVFILGVSSWDQLMVTIHSGLKPSIWWNNMASFIILDQSPTCDQIVNYVHIAWYLNGLLNAKIMCYNHIQGRRWILNYNPFTSQAPASWMQVHIFKEVNNHSVSVFTREYNAMDNNVKCVDLDFVKTTNLGGFEILVDGQSEHLEYGNKNFEKTSLEWARQKRILYTIYRAANVIPIFTGRKVGDMYRSTNADMYMRPFVIVNRFAFSYPHRQFGVVIVSKFTGHKSQLEKILSVTDSDSRIGTAFVYLITLIFFKFFMHQALMPAILNLVRMTCNTGFSNLSDNTVSRIYLTVLLFFIVTMQGIYQGNLASLLTNAVPYKNIDTLKDLVNRNDMIYSMREFDSLIKDAGLEERVIYIDDPSECFAHVLNESAVCLCFAEGFIMDVAHYFDLHLSREFIAEFPVSFPIRRDWYFEEELNIILGKMIEADILEPWDMQCRPFKLDDFQFDKEVLKNSDYKIIELSEVLFAFVILGIGLLCATITFIVEVAMYRY